MKRGVIILVSVVVLIGIVFGVLTLFSKKSVAPGNSTITVWLPFDEADTFKTVAQTFLKANPKLNLTITYIKAKDPEAYEAQVVNAIANGTGPDIWMVRNDWIPKHINKSLPAVAAKNVDAVVAAKKTLIPNLVDANVFNNQLYGVPVSADSLAIIYNVDFYNTYTPAVTNQDQKTALTNIAKTWSDLKLQVQGVSKVNGTTITRSGLSLGTIENTFDSVDALSLFLVQNGVTVLSADGKDVAFNLASVDSTGTTLPATTALDYYTSFAKSSAPNYSWNTSMGDPINAFLNQKTGAIIGYYSTLQQIMAQKPKFQVSVAPMVQSSGAVKDRIDYGNTWSLIVNKDSANTDADWSYLSFLAGTDTENQYAQATGKLSTAGSSIFTSLSEPTLIEASQAKSIFVSQLHSMKSFYKPEWQQVNQILQDTIGLVINNGQSPQTSVDTAASRFKTFVGQ